MEDEGPSWLEPKPTEPLSGEEPLGSSGQVVSDFWRWAFSDLRENIVRGVLAEFLVARAVGDQSRLRHAWDSHDVTTPDGIRIEVKSSAYLQSWRQKKHSRPTFSGLTARAWSYETNQLEAEPSLRADVYVFALHSCREPDQYDPLDLDAWRFYVVPVEALEKAGSPRSVSMSFLDRVGSRAIDYGSLPVAVAAAAKAGMREEPTAEPSPPARTLATGSSEESAQRAYEAAVRDSVEAECRYNANILGGPRTQVGSVTLVGSYPDTKIRIEILRGRSETPDVHEYPIWTFELFWTRSNTMAEPDDVAQLVGIWVFGG